MTETSKKTKAPVKPRAKTTATAKRKTIAEQVIAITPSHQEIAQLALRYWEERGWQDGQAEQDWLRAERELLKVAS